MHARKLTGIILNIRPHNEFDSLIHLFSNELGLVYIIAKGVKRIASRRAFHLDIPNKVNMEIEEYGANGSSPRYLREICTAENFTNIKRSPLTYGCACLITVFLKRALFPLVPQTMLFALTDKFLQSLNKKGDPKQLLLTYLLKANRLLGQLPNVLPKQKLRPLLSKILSDMDPQFILNARRTLEIFSNLGKSRSN